ncbi:lactate utilisation protein LutB domain-containing protein, partial [Actinacidiphila acidipaludis]
GGPTTRHGRTATLKPAKGHAAERAALRTAQWALTHPTALTTGQRLATATRRLHPRRLPGPGKNWTATRDLPTLPAQTFRTWWHHTHPAKDTP